MIGIIGSRTTIAEEFIKLCDKESLETCSLQIPLFGERLLNIETYLICMGKLYGLQLTDMTDKELGQVWFKNFTEIAKFCDLIFDCNENAKICVIGSESGFQGSYDMAYAGAKAAMHMYVEKKSLPCKHQHLVCVSPTIIEDSGMTQCRADLEKVLERGKKRRLGRWLKASEVARVAKFALNEPSLCNTVIRMTGGSW